MSVLQAWIAQATGLFERAWIAQSIESNATSENETVNRDLYGKLINTNYVIESFYQKVILLF